MSAIVCDGNCFECPFPDVPSECLDKPLDEGERKTAVEIDLQSVKYSALDPEKKQQRMRNIRKSAKSGHISGAKKVRPNHDSDRRRKNRAAYSKLQSAIRAARESRGWTLCQLAEKVGLTYQAVNYWELGHTRANWKLLVSVMPELSEAASQAEEQYRREYLARMQAKCSGVSVKGRKLLEERVRRNMTVAEVAESVGVRRGTVYKWERGMAEPSPPKWQKIVTLFPQIGSDK